MSDTTNLLLSLLDQPVLFVDCQTTGATPGRAHLLEVGWVVGSAREEAAPPPVVTRLIALPEDEKLPPRIQKITGISDEDLAAAVGAAEVCAELQGVIETNRLSYAVAHWAQFERTFLGHYFQENTEAQKFAADFICTCQIAKKLYPDLPSRAIRAVAGYFGLSTEEMKRAGGHVETTYFIWQKLAPELDRLGLKNIDELMAWLREPVKKAPRGPALLPLEKLVRLELPDQPGVYRMLNRNGKILYVGKATSLKSRVNSYFTGRKGKDSKTKELISQVFDLDVTPVATPFEAALLENDLIKQHDPPYNRALKSRGRSLLYFSRDFDSAAAQPDSVHILGPFPRGSTIEPLLLMVDGLQKRTFSTALFWGLLDQEQTDRAVKLFFASENIDIDDPGLDLSHITVRKLLAIGMRNFRRYLLDTVYVEESGRDLALTYFIGPPAVSGDDEELEEEADGGAAREVDDVEEEMTDEELAQMVRSLVTGSARAYAMAGTLMRLVNVSISYEEKNRRRRLHFADGVLISSEDVAGVAESDPANYRPTRSGVLPLDLVTYDRLRILLAEVRRLHGRGHSISLGAPVVIS